MYKRLLLLLTTFVALISHSFAAVQDYFLVKQFIQLGDGIQTLLGHDGFVVAAFYFAILFGTHNLFRMLLRFIFVKDKLPGSHKELNVISFMMSFIGTTGIFFLYKDDLTSLIVALGGTIGLLIILLICFSIINFFFNIFKMPPVKSKQWWLALTLALLVDSILLFGYASKLIEEGAPDFFGVIQSFSWTIFSWTCLIGMILGLSLMKRNNDVDDYKKRIVETSPEVQQVGKISNSIDEKLSDLEKKTNVLKSALTGGKN